jgi:hypothetical protein
MKIAKRTQFAELHQNHEVAHVAPPRRHRPIRRLGRRLCLPNAAIAGLRLRPLPAGCGAATAWRGRTGADASWRRERKSLSREDRALTGLAKGAGVSFGFGGVIR